MNPTARTCANCAAFYPDPERENAKPECWNGLGEMDHGSSCSAHMTLQEERDETTLIEDLREAGGIELILKSIPAIQISRALLGKLRKGAR